MALNRVSCPECGAGLKSPSGFNPGQTVCCPKCETYFAVDESADEPKKAQTAAAGTGKKPMKAAAVADDEEFEQPMKKKKKAASDDDPESAYKNSTARYAILGVLVCVMVGLGVMLYLKKSNEAKENETTGNNNANPPAEIPIGTMPIIPGGPSGAAGGGGGPKKGPITPKPKTNPGGGFAIPFVDGGVTLSPAEATAKVKQLQARIAGTWKANLGDGKTAELVYLADGTFTDTLNVGGTPTTISGRWTADRLIAGNKGILITRTVGTTRTSVKAEFEDDELLHDTQERGTIGTFRK